MVGFVSHLSYAVITLVQQTSKDLKIELSLPDLSEVGKENTFDLRFLDAQNLPQGHIDYKYRILKGGLEVYASPKIMHSESGITSFSYNFDSTGGYEIVIEVQGILFQPVQPETAEFSVGVTPEFPFSAATVVLSLSAMMAILVKRIRI